MKLRFLKLLGFGVLLAAGFAVAFPGYAISDLTSLTLSATAFEYLALGVFAMAVAHTFFTSKLAHLAHGYREGSVRENFFHLLGEIEVVFLFWSAVLIALMTALHTWDHSVHYLEGLNFAEPMFVFVIMIVAATKPLIDAADWLIRQANKVLPMTKSTGFLAAILIVGPLLGSVITEPAAMTLSALILLRQFFNRKTSLRLKYLIMATLFVNVSIGGSLTNFAAPPVIMVAEHWNWGLSFMFTNFGWKAALAIVINSYTVAWIAHRELRQMPLLKDSDTRVKSEAAEIKRVPLWVTLVHIFFLVFTVVNAHSPTVFMAGFLMFLGFTTVTQEYQEKLKLKEALLVAGFLAGLVTIGSLQDWWIAPLINKLPELPLFFGAVGLTSFTDNAALTFLAAQAGNLSEAKQYLIVAGALAGGGLTIIANAPNPAGYAILHEAFGEHGHGINPLKLFRAAILPTVVAISCLLWLPNLV